MRTSLGPIKGSVRINMSEDYGKVVETNDRRRQIVEIISYGVNIGPQVTPCLQTPVTR
jgi:hypothetical protein